jgi:hypothetical protein
MLTAASAFGQAPLRPRLTPGTVAKYTIITKDITYDGDTTKVKAQMTNRIPMRLTVTSESAGGAKVEISEGPVNTKGTSIGFPRMHHLTVDSGGSLKGKPCALLAVPFPISGAKVGQSWSGGLYAPTPLPSVAPATYKLESINGPFAKVTMHAKGYYGYGLDGSGEFYVRVSDGYVDHGSVKLMITSVRPDKKNPRKLKVAYHDAVQYSIAQQ